MATMRMVLVVLGLLALAWLARFSLTLGDQGRVAGTVHDLGVTGPPGVSLCETCHLPHDAGAGRLWAGEPRADGTPLSGLSSMCYSCHDGTVAEGSYVFDRDTGQHPVAAGVTGEDCDSCHDPHVSDYGGFLLFPSGANLCRVCHGEGDKTGHSMDVDASGAGQAPRDTHWDPDEGDFSGTRLWNLAGSAEGAYLKCLSCHAAHGAAFAKTLLTWEDTQGAGIAASLCRECHPR